MAITTLFDKFTGNFTSYDNTKIVMANADYKVNYYKGWFCVIDGVEYEITSNSADEIFFNNSLSSIGTFEIVFLGREFLKRIDSDFEDTVKIPDNLISKKYLMASNDIQIRIEEALKLQITKDFNPIENILNLGNLQYAFSYHIAQAVFMDLNGDFGSSFFNERSVYFEATYKTNVKKALSTLIIDRDKDNEADVEEKKESMGIYRFRR
jgi:hypothetical protein